MARSGHGETRSTHFVPQKVKPAQEAAVNEKPGAGFRPGTVREFQFAE
jgi:hypothetical protein